MKVAQPVPPPLPIKGMAHSPDFCSVRWGEKVFTFTPKQRRVVESLWTAMEQGYDYVLAETLLQEAESDCGRLRDLFRGNPAWNLMIVSAVTSGGKIGSYRLVPPPAGAGA